MSKVILRGFILVPDEDIKAIENELPVHIDNTRQEPGCLVFEVIRDEGRANRFNVYEEFANKQAFEAHQDRVKKSKWGKVTTNVERHYEIIE